MLKIMRLCKMLFFTCNVINCFYAKAKRLEVLMLNIGDRGFYDSPLYQRFLVTHKNREKR